MAAPMLLAACQTVAPFREAVAPESLPHGCGKARVKLSMGKPDRACTVVHESAGIVGQVWMYDDYWWSRDGWSRRIGSWDLYFDDQERFIGWRMVTPLAQAPIDDMTRLRKVPWKQIHPDRQPASDGKLVGTDYVMNGKIRLIEQTSATSRIKALPKASEVRR